jgi:hypothetical protein
LVDGCPAPLRSTTIALQLLELGGDGVVPRSRPTLVYLPLTDWGMLVKHESEAYVNIRERGSANNAG